MPNITPYPPSTQVFGLVAWLVVTLAAGALGAVASADAGAFYQQLVRPAWAPAPWIFAPVWTALYVLMAAAAWLVWRQGGWRQARIALSLYLVQLAANALWTWLFFAWHRGTAALVEILVLCALVLATLVAFWRVRRVAGALLVPYAGWVAFAAVLTYAVWHANPAELP